MDLRDQGKQTHTGDFSLSDVIQARKIGKRFNVLDIPQPRDETERMPRWRYVASLYLVHDETHGESH